MNPNSTGRKESTLSADPFISYDLDQPRRCQNSDYLPPPGDRLSKTTIDSSSSSSSSGMHGFVYHHSLFRHGLYTISLAIHGVVYHCIVLHGFVYHHSLYLVLYAIVYVDYLTSYCCKQYIINSTAVQQYIWFCCKRVHCYHCC